jgi:hypothetical protein
MIQLIDKVKAFNNKYSKSLVSVSEEIMVRSHLIAEYVILVIIFITNISSHISSNFPI